MLEQAVTFHTRGGTALAGVLCLPDGASAAAPVPGVVLCQGLSGVKHLVLPEVAATLADGHGLASVRFDYAGYGESEGERGWVDPRARTDDVLHAVAWLADHEAVDAGRLGAYGHSYGGPVAIVAASRDPRIRAVASVSGPGDGDAMLRSVRASWDWVAFRHRLAEERARIARGEPPTAVEVTELLPFSPAFLAAYTKLKGTQGGSSAMDAETADGVTRFWLASAEAMADLRPSDAARRLGATALLLVHGEDDDTAVIETVAPVHANATGPTRWVRLPGLAHNDLDAGPGLQRAIAESGAWFTQHLR